MSDKSGATVDREYGFVGGECESKTAIRRRLAQRLNESRKRKINSELAKGYCEMAEINIQLAEMGINSDNHALEICEQKLAESECCDS